MQDIKIEVKKLDLKPEGNIIKRFFGTAHAKKTLIYIIIGAVGGLLYYYYNEGQHMDTMIAQDIMKNMLVGAFIGFFVTNSPCARGKC